jgi:S-adenosylhomocysteine hydrolase
LTAFANGGKPNMILDDGGDLTAMVHNSACIPKRILLYAEGVCRVPRAPHRHQGYL